MKPNKYTQESDAQDDTWYDYDQPSKSKKDRGKYFGAEDAKEQSRGKASRRKQAAAKRESWYD